MSAPKNILTGMGLAGWEGDPQQDRLHRAALEAAANSVVIADRHGIVQWVNPAFAETYGYAADEFEGRSQGELIGSGVQSKEFYAEMWATITSGRVWSGEVVNRRRDGSLVTEDMTITPVTDSNGEITHFIGIKQNVSERKRLEERAARAQHLDSIRTLAGGIAHDLNNMLAPLQMGLDLLLSKDTDEPSLALLQSMRRSVDEGANLVKKVLSFARGEQGVRMTLFPDQLLHEVHAMVVSGARQHIEVESSAEADLWPVAGDPVQLHEVLLSLAVNGIESMPDGGTLRLTARNVDVDAQFAAMHTHLAPGPYVCFETTDEGTGIPKDVQARMFEPFFTTKKAGKGSGLGLSTSLRNVRNHGGIIDVISDVDRGSSFRVYLPAVVHRDMGELGIVSDQELPGGDGELILLVDSVASVRSVTCKTLEVHGYRVLVAEDGTEAIGVFARNRHEIRVVMTDIVLPAMDGPALVNAIRRMAPDIPVVMWTGHTASDIVDPLVRLGAIRFLEKPFSARALLDMLEELLK